MKRSFLAFVAAAMMMALPALAADFKLTSADVKPGSTVANTFVFKGFGCSGDNISPALSWSGAPAGTKSFAMTVYDPDAPTGSGFCHWTVVKIPASVTSLAHNAGEAGGKNLPARCRVQASRIDAREDICLCPAGGDRVTALVCPAGVRAPAESAAYEKARHAAVNHGSLVGAMYNGQPMCVAPRNALNP